MQSWGCGPFQKSVRLVPVRGNKNGLVFVLSNLCALCVCTVLCIYCCVCGGGGAEFDKIIQFKSVRLVNSARGNINANGLVFVLSRVYVELTRGAPDG